MDQACVKDHCPGSIKKSVKKVRQEESLGLVFLTTKKLKKKLLLLFLTLDKIFDLKINFKF